MIKILLIDDDKSVADSLYDSASRFNFEIEHYQGLEEGLIELERRHREFSGIILDGRGWLSEDMPQETDKHIHTAVAKIKELRKQNIFVPFVINTGHFERLFDQIPETESDLIFDKAKGAEPMLRKLQFLIEDLPQQKLKLKYPEAFSVFGGRYLPIASQDKMISLLGCLEERTYSQANFNVIRGLVEEMLKRANTIDNRAFLPDALLKPGANLRLNLKAAELFLSGRKVDLAKINLGSGEIVAPKAIFTDHVSWLFSSVVNTCQTLSHRYDHPVTKYAFQSSVLALVEVLIWFKEYIDHNYPDLK